MYEILNDYVLQHTAYLLIQNLTKNAILHILHLLCPLLHLLLLISSSWSSSLRPHLRHPLVPDLCQLIITHGCRYLILVWQIV